MPTNDYRDELKRIIDETGRARYSICKELRMRDSVLSNVLAKRRNLSMDRLQEILTGLGYRIEFVKEAQ